MPHQSVTAQSHLFHHGPVQVDYGVQRARVIVNICRLVWQPVLPQANYVRNSRAMLSLPKSHTQALWHCRKCTEVDKHI